jgi:antitoxin PrlF
MSIATLTSKGQVTIPRDVRMKLHLETGEKISFRIDETTGTAVISPMNKTVDQVFGILKAYGSTKPKNIEEMDEGIREKLTRDYQ